MEVERQTREEVDVRLVDRAATLHLPLAQHILFEETFYGLPAWHGSSPLRRRKSRVADRRPSRGVAEMAGGSGHRSLRKTGSCRPKVRAPLVVRRLDPVEPLQASVSDRARPQIPTATTPMMQIAADRPKVRTQDFVWSTM